MRNMIGISSRAFVRSAFVGVLSFAVAESWAYELHVSPGQLSSLIVDMPANETSLRLVGDIDVRDLTVAAGHKGLLSLDMSAARLVAYSSSGPVYEHRTYFADGEMPEYMFFRSGLRSVVLPSNLRIIGEGCFAGSALTEISVPDGTVEIGGYAFYDSADLEKVTFPTSLSDLGEFAFSRCVSLKEADLSSTRLARLEKETFSRCLSLTGIQFPQNLSWVGSEVLSETAVTSVRLPSLAGCDEFAFAGMNSLQEVTLCRKAVLGRGAFMGDQSLENVSSAPADLPALFAANCPSLNSALILSGTETAGAYALMATAGRVLTLSRSLTYLGDGALRDMSGLICISAVQLGDRIPELGENVFEGLDRANIELTVSDDCVEDWKGHPEWGQFMISAESDSGVDIHGVDEEGGISIRISRFVLTAEAADGISLFEIYDASGTLVRSDAPGSELWSVDSSALPAGILVVRVADGRNQEKVVKLIN